MGQPNQKPTRRGNSLSPHPLWVRVWPARLEGEVLDLNSHRSPSYIREMWPTQLVITWRVIIEKSCARRPGNEASYDKVREGTSRHGLMRLSLSRGNIFANNCTASKRFDGSLEPRPTRGTRKSVSLQHVLPIAVQHWIVYLVVVARVHDDITMMSSCTLGCGRSLLVMGIEFPTSFQ